MIEENINFDFDYDSKHSNTELVNLKNPINDTEDEINTTFDNSEMKYSIKQGTEKFFSCSRCSTIVSNTSVCQKCENLYCGNCSCKISKCPSCKSEKQLVPDKNIDFVVSEVFNDGKVVEENLNFGILSVASLKNLRRENTLNYIIKGKEEENDFGRISRSLSQSFIENCSSISSSKIIGSVDDKYSSTTLFDLLENQGKLMKNEIKEIKKRKNDYIDINDALKEDKNSSIFVCGILAKSLINEGIDVLIAKDISKSYQDSIMKSLITGLYKCRIINIHFDFNEKVNNEILRNKKLREDFIKSWIIILSEELNVSQDSLFFKSMYKGTATLEFIITKTFKENKLENIKMKGIGILDIRIYLLIKGCLISPRMFDERYNNNDMGWAKKGEKRGGREYDPPKGWVGYGLNVINKYGENNIWLGMSNIEGEWWVAYHGVGNRFNSDERKIMINNIVIGGFKAGERQFHNNCININNLSNKEHHKVGKGLYLSDKIAVAEGYAGIVEYEKKQYKIAFMCRVCPNKVRIASDKKDYFVVDPNYDCVRPYRILLKDI